MKTWHLEKIFFIALSIAMVSGFLFADSRGFFKSAIAMIYGDKGFSIAVGNRDNHYYAIEVKKDTSSSNISYMLGDLSPDLVKWSNTEVTLYPGSYPQVAILKDLNNAVCFYLNKEKYLCYLVGKIHLNRHIVDWKDPKTTKYKVADGRTLELLCSQMNNGIILVSDNRLLIGKVAFKSERKRKGERKRKSRVEISFGKFPYYIGGFKNELSQIKSAIDYDGSKLVCVYKDAQNDVIYMTYLADYNQQTLGVLSGGEVPCSQADEVEKIFISPRGDVVLYCKVTYPLFCLICNADYTKGTINWDNTAYRDKENNSYQDCSSIEAANSSLQKILKYIKTFGDNTILNVWVAGNIIISNPANATIQHNEEYIWSCSFNGCNVVISPDGNKKIVPFNEIDDEKIL